MFFYEFNMTLFFRQVFDLLLQYYMGKFGAFHSFW